MKPKLFTIILICSSLINIPSAKAWRIEGKYLIIEKGDNLYKIAHELTGRGSEYSKLWKNCIDTIISRNPNKVYDGMRFNIDSILVHNTSKPKELPQVIYNEIKLPEK